MKLLARTVRLLGITLVLSLLILAIPAAPALAAPSVDLSPEEGSIGDEITIYGEGFTYDPENDRWVDFYMSDEEVAIYKVIGTDVDNYENVGGEYVEDEANGGSFTDTFEIPAVINDGDDEIDVTSGTYYIYTTISSSSIQSFQIRTVNTITVIAGELQIDPEEGPVDTLVEIAGEGYGSREDVIVEYDGDEIDIEDGDDRTDSSGDFNSVIRIPESTAGDHTLTITVGSSETEVDFSVEPEILVTPQSGEADSEVTVSGTGFDRRGEVEIYFNDVGVAVANADSSGSFSTTLTVPQGLEAGIYNIDAEDNHNQTQAKFTLTVPPPPTPEPTPEPIPGPTPGPTPTPKPSNTTLSISEESGYIGTILMIGGGGFQPNSNVTIKWDDKIAATTVVDASSIFTATFQVPPDKHGEHIISVSDGVNTNEVIFTVESQAPEAPPPLLPEMGVKVKSPILFDWENVTDKSAPVTYSLQIATDEDFTPDSLVIEKTELTESEYALTEEEELELKAEGTHYYWRVRATDAAQNEGEWTGAGEFYVAGPSNFPNWALYTLLGIGAVVIFGIGYWLGRRTAFYY